MREGIGFGRVAMTATAALAVVTGLVVACGGATTTVDTSSSGSSSGATSSSGGSDASSSGSTSGGPGTPVCPASAPAAGGACAKEGRICEYGADPRCLTTATCFEGKWSVTSPKCAGDDVTCPATYAKATGDCTKMGASCNYDGLVCECTNCTQYPISGCSGPLTWHCTAPNNETGCPPARPDLGSPCTLEGRACNYGCEKGASRTCTNGAWEASSSPGGCPVSLAATKKEVRYLDEETRRALASEALELRLATWRYRDASHGEGPRLGYILDDAPRAPASDMTKGQVDLYAYTSMVLALAQEQEAEIARLQKRVAELEKKR